MLKKRVLDAYFKDLKKDYEIIEYIGIAADEPNRVKDACYPLVEWNMTERDCLEYCYERGFDWAVYTTYFIVFLVGAVLCRALMN